MNFSIGIIGLPNAGKSTLFKALTKQPVDISNYPFCTISPNVGVVKVPDEKLDKIAKIIKPKEVIPAVIEFVDIAGLVKNAHKGEGLGNQFLARIREVDAICQVVRAFEDEKIVHLEKKIDPKRDIETVNNELIMKDLEIIEKIFKKARFKEPKELNEIKKILREEPKILLPYLEARPFLKKELQLMTAKPMIYVFNINEEFDNKKIDEIKKSLKLQVSSFIFQDFQLELELSLLNEEEIKELELPPSKLNKLIKICYEAFSLITFYTVAGGEIVRAFSLKKGSAAPRAGQTVHTDFEKKFIRAEVINWQKLVEAGSWQKAREYGLIKTEGKEYVVKDGDVVEFKI